jgi:hypothetical protein
MKVLFGKQAAERNKPIHDIHMFAAQVQRLQDDLATETDLRVRAEIYSANLQAQLRTAQDHRTAQGSELEQTKSALEASRTASAAAEAKLTEETKLRAQAHKAHNDYRTTTETNLLISKAFYEGQKELSELQVAPCAPEEKMARMQAFEEEYGELGRE